MATPTRPTGAPTPRHPARLATTAMVLLLGLLGVLGVLGATGCGPAADDAAADPPEVTLPDTAVVRIADQAFDRVDVEIPTGDSVRWENDDLVDHELVSVGADVIRSPLMGQAAIYTATFTVPGEYPYYCTIHNYMKGAVVVR